MRLFFRSLLAIALAAFSVITFAGGPMPAEPLVVAPPPIDRTGVYVDLGGGYASVDWGNFGVGSFNGYSALDGSVNHNRTGNYTFGFDVGYQINNFLGMEVGWFYLPQVKGNSDIFVSLPDLKLSSWMAYLALKILIPLSRHFDLIGKVGLGYRSLDWGGNAIGIFGFGDRNADYFTGLFGGGMQYWFDQNWSISAQYLYLLGRTSGGQVSRRAPSANLIVGTVAYIFAV